MLVLNPSTQAQDFYDKDYALSPGSGSDDAGGQGSAPLPTRPKIAPFDANKAARELFPEQSEAASTSTVTGSAGTASQNAALAAPSQASSSEKEPDALDLTDAKRLKIQSIGVLLGAMSQEALTAQLEELQDYIVKYKIKPGPVMAIGPLPFMSVGDSMILTGHGVPLREERALPARYSQVSRLPAWLVETEKGEVVMEGLLSLRKYVNPEGYLAVPSRVSAPGEDEKQRAPLAAR